MMASVGNTTNRNYDHEGSMGVEKFTEGLRATKSPVEDITIYTCPAKFTSQYLIITHRIYVALISSLPFVNGHAEIVNIMRPQSRNYLRSDGFKIPLTTNAYTRFYGRIPI
jgi:hypothetical protein